jgi:hypothetical protein
VRGFDFSVNPTTQGSIMKKAFVIVHHFPRGTKAQYKKTLAAVHPGRTKLPKGQIYHAAGKSAGGWTIVAVHDSKASWQRFREKVLLPTLKKGVKGGFKSRPQEIAIDATTVLM